MFDFSTDPIEIAAGCLLILSLPTALIGSVVLILPRVKANLAIRIILSSIHILIATMAAVYGYKYLRFSGFILPRIVTVDDLRPIHFGLSIALYVSVSIAPTVMVWAFKAVADQSIYYHELGGLIQERERLVHTKETIIAIAAHELRTPVTFVSAYSDMLAEAQTMEEAREYMRLAIGGLARIRQTVDLFSTQLDPISITPFNAERLLQDIVNGRDVWASTRRMPGDVTIGTESESFVIHSDRSKVRFIIAELIRNAIKATRTDADYRITGENAPTEYHIECVVKKLNGVWIFSVTDHGIGIDPEFGSKIFDDFFQIFDSHLTRRFEGNGNGLYVSRNAARSLGGEITYISEPGKGSTFTLTMPVG